MTVEASCRRYFTVEQSTGKTYTKQPGLSFTTPLPADKIAIITSPTSNPFVLFGCLSASLAWIPTCIPQVKFAGFMVGGGGYGTAKGMAWRHRLVPRPSQSPLTQVFYGNGSACRTSAGISRDVAVSRHVLVELCFDHTKPWTNIVTTLSGRPHAARTSIADAACMIEMSLICFAHTVCRKWESPSSINLVHHKPACCRCGRLYREYYTLASSALQINRHFAHNRTHDRHTELTRNQA
jgi:hypothetical protein